MDSLKLVFASLVAFSFTSLSLAADGARIAKATTPAAKAATAPAVSKTPTPSQPAYTILADFQNDSQGLGKNDAFPRRLASGNVDADLSHYNNLSRRLGIDLGLMIPLESFATVANMSPMLGLHFVWEAIEPFSFTVNYRRSSADNKTTPGTGKLSVNYISMGAQASFPSGRFVPFVKIEGGLYFNDYRQDNTTVTGDDALLTTVGASAGLGFDFIVGREVSVGFDGMFHYAVPKNISLSGANFKLGSSWATVGFRLNF